MVGEVVTGFCFFDIRGSEISIQSFLGVSGIRSCSHTISRRRKTAGTNAKCHPSEATSESALGLMDLVGVETS